MDRKSFLQKAGIGMAGFIGGLGATNSLQFRDESDHPHSKNWVWITEPEGAVDEWKNRLEHLKKAGFDAILPQENFENIIPAAEALDMEVHAWLVSLQRGSDTNVQEEHPEWFMVNRNGSHLWKSQLTSIITNGCVPHESRFTNI